MVEREAQLEQQSAFDDAAGKLRIARVSANCPKQDGVVLLQRLDVSVGEDVAGGEKMPGAKGVVSRLHGDGIPQCSLEHLERLGDHLRSDAVSGDHCEVDGCRHRARLLGRSGPPAYMQRPANCQPSHPLVRGALV